MTTRVHSSRTWRVDEPIAAHRQVRDYLVGTGFTLTCETDNHMVAYGGSQTTARAIGMLFASPEVFPRRVVVDLDERVLTVRIDEWMGRAPLGHLSRARYARVFRDWIAGLDAALAALSHGQPTH
jgi:hypothetical protein